MSSKIGSKKMMTISIILSSLYFLGRLINFFFALITTITLALKMNNETLESLYHIIMKDTTAMEKRIFGKYFRKRYWFMLKVNMELSK